MEICFHQGLLSLCRKYAAIVFFANNRFETGKKRLQYLTFSEFSFCADEMIVRWTAGSNDSRKEDLDADFDREFLQELRELKVLISDKDASDQHKGLICSSLKGKITEKAFADIESNFKVSIWRFYNLLIVYMMSQC